MDIYQYWAVVLRQQPDEMRAFFHEKALIRWHNTNEQFTVEEFIRANCEYPGSWAGRVERVEELGELLITVTHVHSADGSLSFHAVSFIKVADGRILSIDEYWGDDGQAPGWRLEKNIGAAIKQGK